MRALFRLWLPLAASRGILMLDISMVIGSRPVLNSMVEPLKSSRRGS